MSALRSTLWLTLSSLFLLGASSGSAPRDFFSLDSGVSVFLADDGEVGFELWRSDGTPTGTYRLTGDLCERPSCDVGIDYLASPGDRMFFLVRQAGFPASPPVALWVSDGTRAGTHLVTAALNIPPGQYALWSSVHHLLYFIADDGQHGLELWRSDGSPEGTLMLTDLAPPPLVASPPRELTEFQGKVFFQATDPAVGPALWSTDGTRAGTRMVRDPWRNRAEHFGPEWLQAAGSRLYFFAQGPVFGHELWVGDGTAKGTQPIADLVPGPYGPSVYDMTTLAGRLYFVADAGVGQELWTSAGTRGSTLALTRFAPAEPFDLPLPVAALGRGMIFGVDDGEHGHELWITDGTPTGTRLFLDFCPGACSSAPAISTVYRGRLYFTADDGTHGRELWSSDGTAEGTRLLRDICPGSCSSSPGFPRLVGGRLLFRARGEADARVAQLWRTNGREQGTLRGTSFERGFLDFRIGTVPGALLFPAWDVEHGTELWRSDGTVAGTWLVKDIRVTP